MTERGTRHHAQSQHADTAHTDQMHAQIEEGRFEIRRSDSNQPQSGKQITGKQNPQHRLFQHGPIPPTVNLYGKNHTCRKGKNGRQPSQHTVRHQHGSQHGQPQRSLRNPFRTGNLRHVQTFGRKKRNNPHPNQANKARHHNQPRLQTAQQPLKITVVKLDVKRRMRAAQHKYCEYGDIVALIL